MADDLKRYLDGEPISARRTPVWERGAKWARRRPIAALLLAVFIAAIPLLLLVALESQRRRNERDRREDARVMAQQGEVVKGVLHARDRLARNDLTDAELTDAEVDLRGLKERIRGEPRVSDDLRVAVEDLLNEVKRRRAAQLARESDQVRHEEFFRRRRAALLHDARFNGLGLPGSPDATRHAARTALELYAAEGPGDSWTLGGPLIVPADESTGLLNPGAVTLADLNGDGIPELIVPNSGSNNVLIYPGLGEASSGRRSTTVRVITRGATRFPSPWPISTATAGPIWSSATMRATR